MTSPVHFVKGNINWKGTNRSNRNLSVPIAYVPQNGIVQLGTPKLFLFLVPYWGQNVPQKGRPLVIIMLTISFIIRTTICYAHTFPLFFPFVVPFVVPFCCSLLLFPLLFPVLFPFVVPFCCSLLWFPFVVPFCCSLLLFPLLFLLLFRKGENVKYYYYAENQLINRNDNLSCTTRTLLLFMRSPS